MQQSSAAPFSLLSVKYNFFREKTINFTMNLITI
jgi:hypothetical protein